MVARLNVNLRVVESTPRPVEPVSWSEESCQLSVFPGKRKS